MNEVSYPRNGRSGRPVTDREDPLAELARIVGADDPFANLFHDAHDSAAHDSAAHDSAAHDSTGQDRAEAEPFEPFAADLRGSYDDSEDVDAFELAASAPGRERYVDDDLRAIRDGYEGDYAASARYAEADEDYDGQDGADYIDDDYEDDASGYPLAEQPSKASRGSWRFAGTALVLLLAGAGSVYAWTNGFFQSSGLPGTHSKPPVIVANSEPVKVKPAPALAPVAQNPATKEIFGKPSAAKPAAPDKMVSREEQPVALPAAAPPLPAPKPVMRSIEPVAEPAAPMPVVKPARTQETAAAPLPAVNKPISTEPRRVRTVKVLADGTVVTGDAPAPARPTVGAAPSGVPSLAGQQAETAVASRTEAELPHIAASTPLPPATAEKPAAAVKPVSVPPAADAKVAMADVEADRANERSLTELVERSTRTPLSPTSPAVVEKPKAIEPPAPKVEATLKPASIAPAQAAKAPEPVMPKAVPPPVEVRGTSLAALPDTIAKPALPKVPETPVKATEPVQPAEPVESSEPIKPAEPVKAAEPVKPAEPVKAVEPAKPAEPIKAAEPVKPPQPVAVAQPAKPPELPKTAVPLQPLRATLPVAQAQPEAPAENLRTAQNLRTVEAAEPATLAAPNATPPARPRNIPAEKPSPAEPTRVASIATASVPQPAAPKPTRIASAPEATGSGSSWVVQVSSQRSQADALAAYKSLASKFPSVVGGLKPSIKQADLGEKGRYYRLRVGNWTAREGATELCVKLKAAGGDCVVSRN